MTISSFDAFMLDEAAVRGKEMQRLRDVNRRLTEALESIAANTCCDRCQEAALVARAALQSAKGEA